MWSAIDFPENPSQESGAQFQFLLETPVKLSLWRKKRFWEKVRAYHYFQ
jgi:hypothetical protein